jgi:hypothetical protein
MAANISGSGMSAGYDLIVILDDASFFGLTRN